MKFWFTYTDSNTKQIIFTYEGESILDADKKYKEYTGKDVIKQSHVGCSIKKVKIMYVYFFAEKLLPGATIVSASFPPQRQLKIENVFQYLECNEVYFDTDIYYVAELYVNGSNICTTSNIYAITETLLPF